MKRRDNEGHGTLPLLSPVCESGILIGRALHACGTRARDPKRAEASTGFARLPKLSLDKMSSVSAARPSKGLFEGLESNITQLAVAS